MAYGTLNILGSTSFRTSGINKIYNTQNYRSSTFSSTSYNTSSSSLQSFGKSSSSSITQTGGSTATADAAPAAIQPVTTTTSRDYLENIVEDVTPQLGGSLDVNGKQITGSSVVINSTSNNGSTQIDNFMMPTSNGLTGQVLTRMGTPTDDPVQMAWTDSSGNGLDYATFEINNEGELVVSYLGAQVDGAFSINANGHLEVTT